MKSIKGRSRKKRSYRKSSNVALKRIKSKRTKRSKQSKRIKWTKRTRRTKRTKKTIKMRGGAGESILLMNPEQVIEKLKSGLKPTNPFIFRVYKRSDYRKKYDMRWAVLIGNNLFFYKVDPRTSGNWGSFSDTSFKSIDKLEKLTKKGFEDKAYVIIKGSRINDNKDVHLVMQGEDYGKLNVKIVENRKRDAAEGHVGAAEGHVEVPAEDENSDIIEEILTLEGEIKEKENKENELKRTINRKKIPMPQDLRSFDNISVPFDFKGLNRGQLSQIRNNLSTRIHNYNKNIALLEKSIKEKRKEESANFKSIVENVTAKMAPERAAERAAETARAVAIQRLTLKVAEGKAEEAEQALAEATNRAKEAEQALAEADALVKAKMGVADAVTEGGAFSVLSAAVKNQANAAEAAEAANTMKVNAVKAAEEANTMKEKAERDLSEAVVAQALADADAVKAGVKKAGVEKAVYLDPKNSGKKWSSQVAAAARAATWSGSRIPKSVVSANAKFFRSPIALQGITQN